MHRAHDLCKAIFLLAAGFILPGCNQTDNPVEVAENQPPVIYPLPDSPKLGGVNQTRNPVLSWAASDADGDSLVYSVYFSDSRGLLDTTTHNPIATTLQPHLRVADHYGAFDSQRWFFWKIVADDGVNPPVEGPLWNFHAGEASLEAIYPRYDDEMVQPGYADLRWEYSDPSGDPQAFLVYFQRDSWGPLELIDTVETERFSWKDHKIRFMADRGYQWRVDVIDADGYPITGPTWHFDTVEQSDEIRYFSPENHEHDVHLDASLRWDNDFYPFDFRGFTKYRIYFGEGSSATIDLLDSISTDTLPNIDLNWYPSNQGFPLHPGVDYFWRIHGVDSLGYVVKGETWSFTTTEHIFANPSPAPGTVDVTLTPVLSWDWESPFGSADTYRVTVEGELEFTTTTPELDLGSVLRTLFPFQTYTWHVTAAYGGGYNETSDTWTFTTGAPSWSADHPPSNPAHGDVWTAFLGEVDEPLTMIYVEGGSYYMGTPDEDSEAHDDERPRHLVTLSQGFWMGKYELTQAQYEAVLRRKKFPFEGMDRPAQSFSYDSVYDSLLYVLNLTEEGDPWRLPTEAEWEYVARAGVDETRFWWGDDPNYTALDDHAWTSENSGEQSHPVGGKLANPWGFHDMLGNVHEFVSDQYASDYYATSPVIDPSGPEGMNGRILRGGSYLHEPFYSRPAHRWGGVSLGSGLRRAHYGVRLVRETGGF